jgi:hypothetical protein
MRLPSSSSADARRSSHSRSSADPGGPSAVGRLGHGGGASASAARSVPRLLFWLAVCVQDLEARLDREVAEDRVAEVAVRVDLVLVSASDLRTPDVVLGDEPDRRRSCRQRIESTFRRIAPDAAPAEAGRTRSLLQQTQLRERSQRHTRSREPKRQGRGAGAASVVRSPRRSSRGRAGRARPPAPVTRGRPARMWPGMELPRASGRAGSTGRG